MISWIEHAKQFRLSGVEILRCRIALPYRAEYPALSDFYRQIAESAYHFCQTVLRSMAEEAYQNCPDINKRFRFPSFLYQLEGEVCYDQNHFLSIRIEVTWKQRNHAPTSHFFDAHTWHIEEETPTLLPPEQIVHEFLPQKHLGISQKKIRGVLITPRQLLLCLGDRWEAIPPPSAPHETE